MHPAARACRVTAQQDVRNEIASGAYYLSHTFVPAVEGLIEGISMEKLTRWIAFNAKEMPICNESSQNPTNMWPSRFAIWQGQIQNRVASL